MKSILNIKKLIENSTAKDKVFYIAISLIFFELVYWFIMFLTNSHWMTTYFVTDQSNTWMDYFNMLANLQHNTPYTNNANYPAMCFLFLKIMYRLIPSSRTLYDGFFLRNYMPATLGYILTTLFSIIIVWELLNSFQISNSVNKKLLSMGLLLCGPMLFTYERGNIILQAFLFLLLFTRFYDSNNRILRLIAYISLAISASLKIYPALFGILLLSKKRYKEAVILVILGILFFLLPFFAFNGLQSLSDMLNGMLFASSSAAGWGQGINFSFNNLIKIFEKLINLDMQKILPFLRILPIAYLVLTYLITEKHWQKIYILTLACIWIPNFSFTYTLILFIIPLLFYLKEEKDNDDNFSFLYGILFVSILIPIALPNIESPDSYIYPLSFPTLIINISILLMSGLILLQSLKVKRNTAKENKYKHTPCKK